LKLNWNGDLANCFTCWPDRDIIFRCVHDQFVSSVVKKHVSNYSQFLLFHTAGSINISNILTGKCLAKIRASNSFPIAKECNCGDDCSTDGCNSRKRKQASSRIRSTVREALEDITALFYDEDRKEIYTGNRHGLVHVWSNWCIVEFVLTLWFLIGLSPWLLWIVIVLSSVLTPHLLRELLGEL